MKFGVIEKREDLGVVEAQSTNPTGGCLEDCSREIWVGNSNRYTNGCRIEEHVDAHWSASR